MEECSWASSLQYKGTQLLTARQAPTLQPGMSQKFNLQGAVPRYIAQVRSTTCRSLPTSKQPQEHAQFATH